MTCIFACKSNRNLPTLLVLSATFASTSEHVTITPSQQYSSDKCILNHNKHGNCSIERRPLRVLCHSVKILLTLLKTISWEVTLCTDVVHKYARDSRGTGPFRPDYASFILYNQHRPWVVTWRTCQGTRNITLPTAESIYV